MTVQNNTFPQPGDPDDATRIAQLIGHSSLTDYVGSGLHLDADFDTNELIVSDGVFYTSLSADKATSDGETIFDLGYVSQVQETTLDLPDSGDHYVFAHANVETTNSPSVGVESDSSEIPEDAVVIGELSVDGESVVEVNRKSELFEQIQSELEEHTSSTTDVHGVGDSDVASVDNVDSVEEELDDHTSATTDIHGVGDSDVASVSDIENHRENSVHEQPQIPENHGNDSHTETFAVNADLINQKERIDQLRINIALEGLGVEDSFYENFVDSENIVGTGGINLVTGTDGYVEVDDFININETITSSSDYSYDKHPKMDVSDLTVDVTGVNNIQTATDEFTATGSTSETEIEVGGTKDPTNAEITLSGGITEDVINRQQTAIGESVENIDLSGNQKPEANIKLSSPTKLNELDNFGGDYYRHLEYTVETDMEEIDEVQIETESGANNVDYWAHVYLDGEEVDHFQTSQSKERYTLDVEDPDNIEGGQPHQVNDGEVDVKIRGANQEPYDWDRIIYIWDVELLSTAPDNINVSGSTDPVPIDQETDLDIDLSTTEIIVNPESGSIDYDLTVIDREAPLDPFVSFAGEYIEHDGYLTEDITKSVDLDGGETHTANAGSDEGQATVSVTRDEITETVDPSISINGQTSAHSGTLDEGQTISLDVDESWIEFGSNTISVDLDDPTVGPEMKVGAAIKATTGKGVVELEAFDTDYVIAQMVVSNTIENGEKSDVDVTVEDDDGNEFLIDSTNIETFVEPNFTGENANVTLELLNYGSQLTEVSLFTDDTIDV